jgi:hypothetical protein
MLGWLFRRRWPPYAAPADRDRHLSVRPADWRSSRDAWLWHIAHGQDSPSYDVATSLPDCDPDPSSVDCGGGDDGGGGD